MAAASKKAKGRWGKRKDNVEPQATPVLPVRKTIYDLPDAVCVAIDNYFTVAECERYFSILRHEIDWRKLTVDVGGKDGGKKDAAEPRLTLFMSDPGICYEYSGRENEGVGWHPAMLEIKEKVEWAISQECGLQPVVFNSVQMNRYEGPRHTLGMHADNEPDLVRDEPIASVSFGVTRDFVVMDRHDNSRQWTIPLADGTFLAMGAKMQQRLAGQGPAARAAVEAAAKVAQATNSRPSRWSPMRSPAVTEEFSSASSQRERGAVAAGPGGDQAGAHPGSARAEDAW